MTSLHSFKRHPKLVSSLMLGVSLTLGSALLAPNVNAQNQAAIDPRVEASLGHEYVVKSGDGLYKLGRKFFGKGVAYKKIVKAHNEKAKTNSRYKPIDPNQGLEVGQVIWIPVAAGHQNRPATAAQLQQKAKQFNQQPKSTQPIVDSKPMVNVQPTRKDNQTNIAGTPIATDYSLPSNNSDNVYGEQTVKKDDPAYVVTEPQSNCEIRIWYNFQLVAIKRINERWKEQGISLIERAKMAHDLRHEARLNGRYMMEDKFEVAALRDRDNKKYGNPDGPTFEHLVAFAKENGLTGDRIYEGIIESSSRVQPVYKSSCVKKP